VPDQHAVSQSSPTEGRYQPLGRAPRRSQPRIIVAYDGHAASPMLFSLEIGLGEPGQERRILPITSSGSFKLPAPVRRGGLLSVCVRGLPEGTSVTIKVVWEKPN
jgi:hypothetical protein